jgi:hypothetical protein
VWIQARRWPKLARRSDCEVEGAGARRRSHIGAQITQASWCAGAAYGVAITSKCRGSSTSQCENNGYLTLRVKRLKQYIFSKLKYHNSSYQ